MDVTNRESFRLSLIIEKAATSIEKTVYFINDQFTLEKQSISNLNSKFIIEKLTKCSNECSILLEVLLDHEEACFPNGIYQQIKDSSDALSNLLQFTEQVIFSPQLTHNITTKFLTTENVTTESSNEPDILIKDEKKEINETNTTLTTTVPFTSMLRQVFFHDIIGCEEAKQSLFENVILPCKLSNQLRKTLFTGEKLLLY